ncbi:hypothetical protein HYR99_33595 [Candidatus Poribacteria bacterium]|nr:hypothetical protein [Candidatus Poribacteria bacterium]
MAKKIDSLPEDFGSLEAAAEFWETHDTTDYPSRKVEDVKIDIQTMMLEIQLDAKVAYRLLRIADEKGISIDALVNALLKSGLESYEILVGKIGKQ